MGLLQHFFIKAFLPFFAVFFVFFYFFSPQLGVFCVFDTFCIDFFREGEMLYVFFVSALSAVFLVFLGVLYGAVWRFSWALVFRRPYVLWGLVGGGGFLMLAGVHILKFSLEAFTPFQIFILPYTFFLDILFAVWIIWACVKRAQSQEVSQSFLAQVFAMSMFTAFFLNMLTLPSDMYSFADFWPFFIFIFFIDGLLVAAMIEHRLKKKRVKKRRQ
jgi:hypothetical protein